MPSHKVLKSVVRSVADQFTSLTNYTDGDYIMAHLLNAARESGNERLSVDLLTGRATPSSLLVPPFSKSVAWHSEGFPDLVRRSGSTMEFVKRAEMTVTFNTSVAEPRCAGSDLLASPYECRVSLLDDRGKEYSVVLTGSWCPAPLAKPTGLKRLLSVLKGGRR